ncbi:MAG TPA: hypothetical protein VFY16_05030 [Gemmatimonadaceae bacterium]|jgi:organic radical activating enzyme|nr:hypothetical protein [Gemmatimonadaceae bacterium]
MKARPAGPAAALVGVLPAVQPQGAWVGRRQIMVRFAGEGETAVMYSAGALAEELRRLVARARFHSIVLTGRDPLANDDFLMDALAESPGLPVMVDGDGQRPEVVRQLAPHLACVQVTTSGRPADEAALRRMLDTLAAAADAGLEHALVLVPDGRVADDDVLGLIADARAASTRVAVVIHPEEPESGGPIGARWSALLARAVEVHDDVRLQRALRTPVIPR